MQYPEVLMRAIPSQPQTVSVLVPDAKMGSDLTDVARQAHALAATTAAERGLRLTDTRGMRTGEGHAFVDGSWRSTWVYGETMVTYPAEAIA